MPSAKPTIDEQSGHCFGCGPANSQGLHLHFTHAADQATGHPTVSAEVRLTRTHEGAPGYIHGGIIATLLDEAMSKLNRPLGALAMTRHMEIDYLRPASLNQTLLLTASHVSRPANPDGTGGRKLFHEAQLKSSDGTILARAKGLFVAINPNALSGIPSSTKPAGH